MIMKLLVICFALGALIRTTNALPVHHFPGIDAIIEDAQHIAVVTIVKHVSGYAHGYADYHVWVRRTLKGSIPEGRSTAMSLLYAPYVTTEHGILNQTFMPHHTYIMFLEDNDYLYPVAPYRNLQMIGSHWDADLPHPDWVPDEGKALRETIELLIELHIEQRKRAIRGFRETFNEVFKGKTPNQPMQSAFPGASEK